MSLKLGLYLLEKPHYCFYSEGELSELVSPSKDAEAQIC